MNHRLKIYLSIALGLSLTGIWLYIVDFGEMFNVIREIKILFLFPLGIFFILMYFLRSLRWKIILSPVEKISAFDAFNLCMNNYFINFLIPVHAGEIAKSLLLKKMKGTPVSKSLITVYLDKVMDALPIILLLIVSPFLKKQLSYTIYFASGFSLLLLLFFVLFIFIIAYKKDLAMNWAEKFFFFLPNKPRMKLKGFLNLFIEGIHSLTRLSNRLFEIFGLTILALLVHCTFMWMFFYSFGIKLAILTVIVGYLLMQTSFVLPAPPGYAGTMELSFLFIFTYLYGYDRNLVSAVAASAHIFSAFLFGFFGLLSIAFIGTKLSTILNLEYKKGTDLECADF